MWRERESQALLFSSILTWACPLARIWYFWDYWPWCCNAPDSLEPDPFWTWSAQCRPLYIRYSTQLVSCLFNNSKSQLVLFCLPFRILTNASSTLVESNADVSMNDMLCLSLTYRNDTISFYLYSVILILPAYSRASVTLTTRLALMSHLLPTSIRTACWSAIFFTSSYHLFTFKKEFRFVMS